MKIKSFIAAGLIAAAVSPAMADNSQPEFVVNRQTGEGAYIDPTKQAEYDAANAARMASAQKSGLQAEMTKCKSKKGHWLEDRCVPKNPCKSKDAADKKYCIDTFKKVQIATPNDALKIVEAYAINVLKWDGCARITTPKGKAAKSKGAGQDFLVCENADLDIRVFEFDDLSESNPLLAYSNYSYAMCIAFNGKATLPRKNSSEVVCAGISKTACENGLNGEFESNVCTVVM